MNGPAWPLRRSLLAALAALAAAPLAGIAQPLTRRRIALVGWEHMFEGPRGLDEVARSLGRRGYADGRQVEFLRVVMPARAEEEGGRGFGYLVPKLEQLVLPLKPDVIVVLGSIMAGGMQRATRTIPIVTTVADPVAMGLAASISRPGGNVTGLSGGMAETAVKAMEFTKALVPRLARIAIFHDSRDMASRFAATYAQAARDVGVDPLMIAAFEGANLVRALRELPPGRAQAGLMAWSPPDGVGDFYREAIARRLPLVGVVERDAEAGALVAYTAYDRMPSVERLAAVIEQLLRGGDPATIPFQYPDGFRLVVNRRTAAALGIVVPPDLLLRADRVIE